MVRIHQGASPKPKSQQRVAELEQIDRKEYVAEIMRKFDLLYERGLTQMQLAVSHTALIAQSKLLHLN